MIISCSWLSEYVKITMAPERLADELTMAGLEVEGLYERYSCLDTVLTAKVSDVKAHPNADHLKTCTVTTGRESFSVVCGAPNLKDGMITALALPGTVLPGGMKVLKSTVRNEISEGMLASENELGIGPDASGIMEFAPDTEPGRKVSAVLNLSDSIIELGITPNRPDCLSLIGIAREVAAICKSELIRPAIQMVEDDSPASEHTAVKIINGALCPRYAARVLKGVKIGPSPFWLADRLLAVGQRPINNIVDVTNFVMLETGQPLHAFDHDLLANGNIVVREALAGEKFQTLDMQEKELDSECL